MQFTGSFVILLNDKALDLKFTRATEPRCKKSKLNLAYKSEEKSARLECTKYIKKPGEILKKSSEKKRSKVLGCQSSGLIPLRLTTSNTH